MSDWETMRAFAIRRGKAERAVLLAAEAMVRHWEIQGETRELGPRWDLTDAVVALRETPPVGR